MNMRSTLEEQLRMEGQILIRGTGISMRPFLRENRDLLVIKKPDRPIRKYDVVLFYYDGRQVLHRVIGIKGDCFTARGDNRLTAETNIRREDVIGVLSEIIRDGKRIPADSFKNKMYARFWHHAYIFRAVIMKIKGRGTLFSR